MTDDQQVLSAWLAELEAEHAERAIVIASLKAKLGRTDDSPSPSAAEPSVISQRPARDVDLGPLRRDSFFGLNVPDAIRKYLAMVKRPQSPKQITSALQQGGVLSQAENFYANVSTSLKRLRQQGIAVNTAEGWGLAAWYGGRTKQQTESPPKKPSAARKVEAAKKKPSKPKLLTSGATATTGGWHQFLGEATKRGKSMSEAAAEWKALKAG